MACSSCGARAAAQQTRTFAPREQVEPINCDYTKSLLQNWLAILQCVKTGGKLPQIDLSIPQANVYLGYLQSALNYPDNYCYYINKLQDFQLNILPRIIAHVSQCLN